MLRSFIGSGAAFTDILIQFLISIPAVLIAISVHEAAHGYMAYKLGDPTAKLMGRVTIRPWVHFDLMGAICMLLFGFGWAKPVLFDIRNLKHPKRDTALIAAAGPISNFLVGFFTCGVWVACSYIALYVNPMWLERGTILSLFLKMLAAIMQLNFSLMLFNFMAIPPLDGSKVLLSLLPARAHRFVLRYERYGMPVLMLLLIVSDYLPWFLRIDYYLGIVVSWIYQLTFTAWNFLATWILEFIV